MLGREYYAQRNVIYEWLVHNIGSGILIGIKPRVPYQSAQWSMHTLFGSTIIKFLTEEQKMMFSLAWK